MWNNFELYSIVSLLAWAFGIILLLPRNSKLHIAAEILSLAGIVSLGAFTVLLWIKLERPPLRTLGETRLWYSLFIAIIGYLIHKRWSYRYFLMYALSMGCLFLLINIANPDIRSKALMPALQSVWFVPHVIVYIAAYAFLGFSSLLGLVGLVQMYKQRDESQTLQIAVDLVHIGFGFLSLGLVFGALWAKEAWGHYWTWDPKETWALLTWGVYLVFIHIKVHKPHNSRFYLSFLLFAFIILLISWFGVNYLPSAQSSVHVYSN